MDTWRRCCVCLVLFACLPLPSTTQNRHRAHSLHPAALFCTWHSPSTSSLQRQRLVGMRLFAYREDLAEWFARIFEEPSITEKTFISSIGAPPQLTRLCIWQLQLYTSFRPMRALTVGHTDTCTDTDTDTDTDRRTRSFLLLPLCCFCAVTADDGILLCRLATLIDARHAEGKEVRVWREHTNTHTHTFPHTRSLSLSLSLSLSVRPTAGPGVGSLTSSHRA